MKKENWT